MPNIITSSLICIENIDPNTEYYKTYIQLY